MDDSIYILFFCAIFSAGVCSGKEYAPLKHDPSDLTIVGGRNTTIQEHPYQVYFIASGANRYACGGSIIGPTAILTAAHCLNGANEVSIRIGSTNSQSGGYEYHSSNIRPHPQYSEQTIDYDVGVITLDQSMTLDGTNTKIIPLPEEGASVPAGSNVIVTGWGRTSESGEASTTLMEVTVPVLSDEECSNLVTSTTFTDRMFCAGFTQGGKDSCQGDSGGPAISDNGIQQGIVSFGAGCARPNSPGVYTRISRVRSWIKQETGV